MTEEQRRAARREYEYAKRDARTEAVEELRAEHRRLEIAKSLLGVGENKIEEEDIDIPLSQLAPCRAAVVNLLYNLSRIEPRERAGKIVQALIDL